MIARPIRQLGGGRPHIQDGIQTKTDAEGKFVFTHLPPVPTVVAAYLGPWRDSPITSSQEIPLDAKPGQTYQLTLGGNGLQVSGKVRLMGDGADRIQFRYGLNKLEKLSGGISTPLHACGKNEDTAGEAKAWRERMDADLDPTMTRESHFVKLRDDGTFLINGVAEGRYRLLFKIYEPPTGCLIEPIGYGFLEFSSRDYAVTDNQIDLGEIVVQLKPIPREGDPIPDFRFQDINGKPHQISQLRGKYVLIDFWASWCQPCLKQIPELGTIHREMSEDGRVEILSISVDGQFETAKTAALQHQMTWPVGFIGEVTAKGSSASMLGIGTVPTLLVIDPQGKLLYRGFSLDQAAKVLRSEISTKNP